MTHRAPRLPLEALQLIHMASGHLALNLTEQVNWAAFPSFARKLVELLGGQMLEDITTVDVRLWLVELQGTHVWLAYEDYPLMVSLESSDVDGDSVLQRVAATLGASAP